MKIVKNHLSKLGKEFLMETKALTKPKMEILEGILKKEFLNYNDFRDLSKCRNVICQRTKIDAKELHVDSIGEATIPNVEKYKQLYGLMVDPTDRISAKVIIHEEVKNE